MEGMYGDNMCRSNMRLTESQTAAIIDVIFGDADTYTYGYDPIDKLLAIWNKKNKYKHGKYFQDQRRFFLSFPLSEWHAWEGGSSHTLEFESTHGRKLKEQISHIRVWVNGHIAIAIARSYS